MAHARRIVQASFLAVLFISISALPAHALPKVERMTLANGLVVLFSEDHSLPSVTLQLVVNAGSRHDPARKEGLAYITGRALLLGTAKRSQADINEQIDFMGASQDFSAGRDLTSLGLKVLKKHLHKGFEIFFDELTGPVFPAAEVGREIQRAIGAIQSADDDPLVLAEKAYSRTLFSGNPYGHPVEGTEESLKRINRDDILNFYRTWYHPNAAVLAIVGDLNRDELRPIISRLESWNRAALPEESFPVRFAENKTVTIDKSTVQASIILGNRGVSRLNPDYYALTMMNYILGGAGFGSRLFDEIRVKRGLAYSIQSFFLPEYYSGSFQVVLQTKNPSARESIQLCLREMRRIQQEGVSAAEVEKARKYLIGSFPLRFDTQRKLARFLCQVEYYKLGLNYISDYPSLIRDISVQDVTRVAKEYLHPDRPVLVVVGNLKEAGFEKGGGEK